MSRLTRREFSVIGIFGVGFASMRALPARQPKMFAVVYQRVTKQMRRLIDTADDFDDRHLVFARAALQQDEVMEAFPVSMFPVRRPRFVAPYIDRGIGVIL